MSEQKSKGIIAPFYDDDEGVGQIITAALSSSSIPSVITSWASTASSQEGESIVGVVVIDASSTMYPNRQAVVDGMNIFREALMKSHERRKTNIMIIFFDQKVKAWKPFGDEHQLMTVIEGDEFCLPEFTLDIYDMHPQHAMTALYGAFLEGMASVDLAAKAVEEEQGVDTRLVVTVVSDGFDNSSEPGHLAQLKQLIKLRRLQEGYTAMFYGLVSDQLRNEVALSLGVGLATMSEEERTAFDERIFRAVACGGDTEMENAIRTVENRGELGGIGMPGNMVVAFPSDPERIREMIGVRMSSTFIKAGKGTINAGVPLSQQGDPDPNASPGPSFV